VERLVGARKAHLGVAGRPGATHGRPRRASARTSASANGAALTPEQRRLARQNYRLAKRLPPDERQAQWERYRELTPEQRAVLRNSGWTSNTAARHAGARTGLAKEAAQPLSDLARRSVRRPSPPRPSEF
jgi:Protein of unknown function (DUF3106).